VDQLEKRLGYRFRQKSLLENALTHSSYANENKKNSHCSNERLEFLGDSVLGFVVAEYLYHRYPEKPEGELTRMRADLVCERSLAAVARSLQLGHSLRLGHGEMQSGGRQRDSILADAVESILAAAYLDGGFAAAAGIIDRHLLQECQSGPQRNSDFKTALQELVQREKDRVIQYQLISQSGPDHDKTFTVEVYLDSNRIGRGVGHQKKLAEQMAARDALSLFGIEV